MRTFALSDEFFWKGLENRTLENTYWKEKLIVKVSKTHKSCGLVDVLGGGEMEERLKKKSQSN